jgi:hypothetical protein
MNKNNTAEANCDTFDGDAISRADREFLASLSDHPLAQHPLYSVPPPPRPDYAGCMTIADRQAAQQACFIPALDWVLVNYAYHAGAFIGKGGIISLVDGKMWRLESLRNLMQPYTIISEGPRGGLHKTTVVDVWMAHPRRAGIDDVQMRPNRSRPTFEEDGLTIYNTYWPPAHPTSGGSIAAFEIFFASLVPDESERKWLWHWLAHKVRRPWVPMVAVIMVAEEFGSGRGTLFDILGLLFGSAYVVPCSFDELTGKSAAARFNSRLADALFVVVNEAVAEDGQLQAQRRLHYDALKNAIEPSPTAQRRFEKKGHDAYTQTSAASTMFATNHRDVVKLPADDRRFCVLTCGARMTAEQTAQIRAWMAVTENIGALYRALLAEPAVPTTQFNPFDEPPAFTARREMIGMARSSLEEAYDASIDALADCELFTMSQMQRLMSYAGLPTGSDVSARARHLVGKNAYRLRERTEPNNRIKFHKRDEVIYARTRAGQAHWRPAETKFIVEQLERTERWITQVINSEHDVLADFIRRRGQ